MVDQMCQGKTKKGLPCKNTAVIGHFCNLHANSLPGACTTDESTEDESDGQNHAAAPPKIKKISVDEPKTETVAESIRQPEDNSPKDNPPDSSKAFDAIVNAGANLVNQLEQAIEYIPNLMDNIFTFSGSKFVMPKLSKKMQEAATNKSRNALRKLQTDLINQGSDPEKLNQLMKKISKLEKTAYNLINVGGSYIPESLKKELIRSFTEIQKLRESLGVPGSKAYLDFYKSLLKPRKPKK